MRYGSSIRITTDYTDVGRIQYLLGKRGIHSPDAEYTDRVTMRVCIPAEDEEAFCKELVEATGARVQLETVGKAYYVDKG